MAATPLSRSSPLRSPAKVLNSDARATAGGREGNSYNDIVAWEGATQRTLRQALSSKDAAAQARGAAVVLGSTSKRETRDNSDRVSESIRKKIAMTEGLKAKLEKAIAMLSQEMHMLTVRRRRTVELLTAQQGPLAKARHRLRIRRQRRPARENFHDDVQEALVEEASDLQRAVDQLLSGKGDCSVVLDQMAMCKAALREDLADKVESLRLDKMCLSIQAEDAPKGLEPRTVVSQALSSAMISPEVTVAGDSSVRHIIVPSQIPVNSWKGNTEHNIERAAELVREAQQLRQRVASFSKSALESNTIKGERTRMQLETKIGQTEGLSNKLQTRIQELTDEVLDTQRERAHVAAQLAAKEQPLNTCIRRLALRRARPAREAVRDETEMALQNQLSRLVQSCQKLTDRQTALVKREHELRRTRADLEKDRVDKESARAIDADLLALDPGTPEPSISGSRSYSGAPAVSLRRPVSAPPSIAGSSLYG